MIKNVSENDFFNSEVNLYCLSNTTEALVWTFLVVYTYACERYSGFCSDNIVCDECPKRSTRWCVSRSRV